MNPQPKTVGRYTFSHIDDHDDVWRWAIVQDFEHPDFYGPVVMSFAPGGEPEAHVVAAILTMLDQTDQMVDAVIRCVLWAVPDPGEELVTVATIRKHWRRFLEPEMIKNHPLPERPRPE